MIWKCEILIIRFLAFDDLTVTFRSPRKLAVGDMVEFPVIIQCPSINFLEHVQLTANVSASNRGQLEIVLRSPSGEQNSFFILQSDDAFGLHYQLLAGNLTT